MSDIENYDAKVAALRELVSSAVVEVEAGKTWDTPVMDLLADTLKTTDALYVLDAILNGDNA